MSCRPPHAPQSRPPGAAVSTTSARLANCVEQLQLAFPFLTIEPLIRQSGYGVDADSPDTLAQRRASRWNPNLDDVQIRINTAWHGIELSAGQLASLKCGDVLMLQPNCFENVEVRFEEHTKFHGRLGTSQDHFAVELTNTAPI